MKVAILHDWLVGFRGGERVLEAILELYPTAEVYTLIHQPGSTSPTIEARKIHTSFLNKVPKIYKYYRHFLPIFPLAVKTIHLPPDVDLVISSSHCVIKGVKKPLGAKHLSYIHSPMRYIYDQFAAYFGPGKPIATRLIAYLIRPYLQTWDRLSNNHNIDLMIANSSFVQKRIELFYGKPSSVIHPFVDLEDFKQVQKSAPAKKNFYLMVTALAPNKRVDLAIEAFNLLEKPLIIVGAGQDEYLRKLAKPNITFMGQLSRQEIIHLMAEARGFIFPGIEDFGITPLESLAAGTPVIAYRAGGVLETLNPKVAQFFQDPTAESLAKAIELYRPESFKKEDLFQRAEQFSKIMFQDKIQKAVQKLLSI